MTVHHFSQIYKFDLQVPGFSYYEVVDRIFDDLLNIELNGLHSSSHNSRQSIMPPQHSSLQYSVPFDEGTSNIVVVGVDAAEVDGRDESSR